MINNRYTLIIFALFFSFKTSFASEPEEFNRDYTASTSRVIPCQIGEHPIVNISPFLHYGYHHNKDLVDNVLVCLDSNNKLFTCYSEYKMVDHWELSGGNYRDKPVIKKILNVLTETDPYSKIEYKFNDVPELCNEHPVNDIARKKNNYYVAHQNNVYIYQSNNAYIVSPTLLNVHHLTAHLMKKDVIKKMFIDENDNILAVSSSGSILKNSSLISSSKKQTMTLLSQSFPRNEKLYSVDYNEQNNLVLLGGHNFVHMVQLGNSIKSFRIPINQLRINTIDTNDNYILLSDISHDQNTIARHHYKGHSAAQNCCVDKQSPYSSLPDCDNCLREKEKWAQDKKKWENEPVNIPQQQIIRSNVLSCITKEWLDYDVPQPPACTHKKIPTEFISLINSCKKNTVLLLSFSQLMATITNKSIDNLTLSDFIEHRIDHEYSKKNGLLTHAFLTNDFLFTGYNIENNNGPYNTYLYKTQLSDIKSTEPSLLYHKNESETPSKYGFNPDYEYSQLMKICKHKDTKTIAAISIRIPCSGWCQGGCIEIKHWLQTIGNIVLLTKNVHKDSLFHSLTKPLHRKLHYFKNNLSLVLAKTGLFLYIACSIKLLFYLKS